MGRRQPSEERDEFLAAIVLSVIEAGALILHSFISAAARRPRSGPRIFAQAFNAMPIIDS